MPMVGHIAQTGQIVAVDFRQGNIPPNKDNLAFIKQCQQSLPVGVTLGGLRIETTDHYSFQLKIVSYRGKYLVVISKSI